MLRWPWRLLTGLAFLLLPEAFLPPRPSCRRPRRGAPTARRSATEQPRDDESGRNPLKESWEGFNATYSKLWTGEQPSAEDVQRDLDVTFALSLATGTFDSYVKAAPAAQPPDCVSYNTQGACCPSLACYKDLPLGVKIYVTILLLLAMRGGVRMITEARSQAVRE
ncbi:Uncharacterized protein SCF082_LOCUS8011 [Durusdinium trenchii]|uniref:Uncharacterized protein n=1 Tax=Durusdinium trenchii TaxID=1381693 RepID=A0ABP0IRN7_9DINO